MKKYAIFLSVLLFLILWLCWPNIFFGEVSYIWFLLLIIESILLYLKKYKISFFLLIILIPIILIILYAIDSRVFLDEIFGAVYLLNTYLIYLIINLYKDLERPIKTKSIVGIILLTLIMIVTVDFRKLLDVEKPVFMISINDYYYGLGYKAKSKEIYNREDSYVHHELEFGFWFYTWDLSHDMYVSDLRI